MSEADQDLSPWAHPKARAWFRGLFNRTQFGFVLEDVLKQPDEHLSHDQIRAVLAFAVLLSREETWPEEHRSVLSLILDKARAVAARNGGSGGGKTLTLKEVKRQGSINTELQEEIEILRRRLGKSAKTKTVQTPSTWEPFWT